MKTKYEPNQHVYHHIYGLHVLVSLSNSIKTPRA